MKFNQILDSFANVELASLKHLFSKYDFKYDCILPMPMHLHLTWKKNLALGTQMLFQQGKQPHRSFWLHTFLSESWGFE